MNERVKAILDFWFIDSSQLDHFKKNKNFDLKIQEYFENDYNQAINNELEDWQDYPYSCLALIILLDQFSRNLNRNNILAFSNDNKARLIANEAIDRGDLESLNVFKRLYLLLPLIHSEDISDHIFAHKLYDSYLKDHPNSKIIKEVWDDHTNVIKKFGRYPSRNQILNRGTTISEKEYLSNKNSD